MKGVINVRSQAYENSKLKHQLLERKRRGYKELIWKLNPKQRKFIEQTLGFNVEPYLFNVKTRTFSRIRELDPLLKEIHFKNKRGIKNCVFRLNIKQRELLDEYGIKFTPYKYRIKLN